MSETDNPGRYWDEILPVVPAAPIPEESYQPRVPAVCRCGHGQSTHVNRTCSAGDGCAGWWVVLASDTDAVGIPSRLPAELESVSKPPFTQASTPWVSDRPEPRAARRPI